MNLYTLIFKKQTGGEEFTEVFQAVDDNAARTAADLILIDYPDIISYDLFKSGEKITYTRGH